MNLVKSSNIIFFLRNPLPQLDGGIVRLHVGDIKKLYPDIRVLVGSSIYVKASVVTTSGEPHETEVSINAR